MIEYRITLSKKPTLRLWRVEGKKRKLLAEVENKKATLTEEIILRNIPLNTYLKFRDGRIIYTTEEESALKLLIALKGIIGLRDFNRITNILESVNKMERGEIFWWYSLYLKIGHKAIQALRTAYIS
ncbi:hypothetical protein J7L60_05290 [Candidatus Bathyarchaeota archaeon]|nr:hypothetical protein [Candidatus Bathyarchaeota archaeon]